MFTRDEAHETREFITLIGSAAALPLFRLPIASAQEPGHIYRLAIMTGAARAVHEWSRIDYSVRGEECHLAL
jgi:hypothetical protein